MSACSDTVAGSRLLTPFVLSVAESKDALLVRGSLP